MNNSKLEVLAFFALRELLEDADFGGESMTDLEILEAAVSYVDVITERKEVNPFREAPASHPMPVDKALADGGWRVMARNPEWYENLYEDDDSQ